MSHDQGVQSKKVEFDDVETIIPPHVLSVKTLDDHKKLSFINKSEPNPTTQQVIQSAEEYSSQGVKHNSVHSPEHLLWDESRALNDLQALKEEAEKKISDPSLRYKMIETIVKLTKQLKMEGKFPDKNSLKKGKKMAKDRIEEINVVTGKRKSKKKTPIPNSTPMKKTTTSATTSLSAKKRKHRRKWNKKKLVKGMRVSVPTKIFDGDIPGSWSSGKPRLTYGIISKVEEGRQVEVLWDGDSKLDPAYFPYYVDVTPAPYKVDIDAIMSMLELGGIPEFESKAQKSSWPKDFFEAMLRDDWRDWIESIKKEQDGWNDNDATTEVPRREMEMGASVIPLGELFSKKRSGTYKFRQYAMGNLLKAGKDYGDTFSATASADGLRWFVSLACACGKLIKGWDATTGYLQTKQRVPVYAYLPSHYKWSSMEYEELAVFRNELLSMEKKNEGSVKELSRKVKRESRQQPKTVLKINSAVYGIGDAGQAFWMFMQSIHLKKLGMTQCQTDPTIFYKYKYEDSPRNVSSSADGTEAEGRKITGYIFVLTFVDDVRYFGTDDLVKEYETEVQKHCKCKLEGESKEFISIQMKQDLKNGTTELTQPDYWEKSVERFKQYLGREPKERSTPLSVADYNLLKEATDEEVKEASHLPYPQLIGTIQYASAFTKLESRFAVSTLSRFRGRWSKTHFAAALKALEYGYATRHIGVKYTKPENDEDANVLRGYADSGFSTPRSQGCRMVWMNGAAISYSSKRHTTTDDSTAAAELTEMYLCSCDVEGLRNLMQEVGLCQDGPTLIYQDNQPAIQISMNRGALSKKTRAMSMRVLSVRNKIEDAKVIPVYLPTDLMTADIGTKALDSVTFAFHRDRLCGYVEVDKDEHITHQAKKQKT